MLKGLYNLALFLFVIISLPKWLWEAFKHRKHRESFLEKFGWNLPTFQTIKSGPSIWVHSISVGETKAISPLIHELQKKYPTAFIAISTVSETGQEEAKRSIPGADAYFFLPLDFSWTMRTLVKKIQPDLLILAEGDFWFNLIDQAPRVALVNGKISEKSLSRFKKVPFFSHRLFGKLELLCVQSHRFKERFIELGVDPEKIVVTGNLKLDQPIQPIDKEKWRKRLNLAPTDRVITIGSTHAPEEEKLLDALAPLFQKYPRLKILLVPRHPERFNEVASLLEKKGIPFNRYSNPTKESAPVTLIDTMGLLNSCYQLSEVAIVGGSFITHVGGHNIFEPAALGVPVFFGPSIYSQTDLAELVTQAGAGRQVTFQNIAASVDEALASPPSPMQTAGLQLASEVHGSTRRTLRALEKHVC